MDYIAEAKNIKMSPRKVRLVVEGIKKFDITVALANLYAMDKRASTPVRKVIESAIANAVNNFKAAREGLYIREMTVNEGLTYKRFHFAARGRTRPYKKRTSHLRVVLSDKQKVQTKPVVTADLPSGEEKKGGKGVKGKEASMV